MKKHIILFLNSKSFTINFLLIFILIFPLYGENGIIISSPDSIMYDRSYGLEVGRIPYKKKIEIVDVKRIFSRVKYDGLTGFIANSQYMEERNYKRYLSYLKEYGKKYRFCVSSVPRKIPFFDLKLELPRHLLL
jgi:hypothetical protein